MIKTPKYLLKTWMRNVGCLEWLALLLSTSKRTLNDVCSIGIYTIPGWPITHLGQKFNFELNHPYSHPTFPGCSFSSSVYYGKDQCTAFLLLSTRAERFSLVLTSWLSSQMEVWVLFYSPRENICPLWVWSCCEKRDSRVLFYSYFLSSWAPGKMSEQLVAINSPSVISNTN